MKPGMKDEDLIEEFQQGRPEAFEELVRRHQRPLLNFFYRAGWDAHVAEDCAQEVFLRLYRHLPHFDPRAKFTTFLYRIARNLWIDRIRSLQARGKSASLDGGDDREAGMSKFVGGASPNPHDQAVQGEDVERLRDAIAELPEELKMVVLLAEYQSLKYEEIGEVLAIPVGTVKSRMHAAIERLRGRLTPKATK